MFHFKDQKEFLDIIELISTAVTGVFGIVGVFADTKTDKNKGGLNLKGYVAIMGLVVGTIFTMWLKQQKATVDNETKKAEKKTNDSIQQVRALEYKANIEHLHKLEAMDTVTINSQHALSKKQTDALHDLHSLDSQESANLVVTNRAAETMTELMYPLIGLTANGIMTEDIRIDTGSYKTLRSLLSIVTQRHPKLFGIQWQPEDKGYKAPIFNIRSDSLLKLINFSRNSSEFQLFNHLTSLVTPYFEFTFYENSDKKRKVAYMSLSNSSYTFSMSLMLERWGMSADFNYVFENFHLSPMSKEIRSLSKLDKSVLTLRPYTASSWTRTSSIQYYISGFSIGTKYTGRTLFANMSMQIDSNTFVCGVY